jgi:hypothetical protein
MNRNDVYKLIDGERDYQDSKPPRPDGDSITPVSSWLIYIEKKLNEAKENVYFLDNIASLERIRQIAALCVACMEYNETKPRQ